MKNLPFTLDIVGNGVLAIEEFKKNSYDLILMDMQMPELDGFSATKEIRRLEQLSGRQKATKIIALTAFALL